VTDMRATLQMSGTLSCRTGSTKQLVAWRYEMPDNSCVFCPGTFASQQLGDIFQSRMGPIMSKTQHEH